MIFYQPPMRFADFLFVFESIFIPVPRNSSSQFFCLIIIIDFDIIKKS